MISAMLFSLLLFVLWMLVRGVSRHYAIISTSEWLERMRHLPKSQDCTGTRRAISPVAPQTVRGIIASRDRLNGF